MNNQNIHLFNGDIENAISLEKRIKDKYYKLNKNPRNDSGLKSPFNNELHVEGGVVRTRVRVNSKTYTY